MAAYSSTRAGRSRSAHQDAVGTFDQARVLVVVQGQGEPDPPGAGLEEVIEQETQARFVVGVDPCVAPVRLGRPALQTKGMPRSRRSECTGSSARGSTWMTPSIGVFSHIQGDNELGITVSR